MLTVDFAKLAAPNSADQQPRRLLDLGCGEGRHTIGAYWLLNNWEIIGVDKARADLTIAKHKFDDFRQQFTQPNQVMFIEGDGLDLPFANHSFDVIICSEVLEHIPDVASMLREIKRLLKPGGQLALSVPRYWPEKLCWWLSDDYHSNEGGHLRIFGRGELRRQVHALGFHLHHQHYAHSLHSCYWWLRCLFWRSGEQHPLCQLYHRFLVWDLMQKPLLTRWLDAALNPVMGKSLVLYCRAPL